MPEKREALSLATRRNFAPERVLRRRGGLAAMSKTSSRLFGPATESAFDDADDRLARRAMFGGERCGRFGERPYRSHNRLQPSVLEALGEIG